MVDFTVPLRTLVVHSRSRSGVFLLKSFLRACRWLMAFSVCFVSASLLHISGCLCWVWICCICSDFHPCGCEDVFTIKIKNVHPYTALLSHHMLLWVLISLCPYSSKPQYYSRSSGVCFFPRVCNVLALYWAHLALTEFRQLASGGRLSCYCLHLFPQRYEYRDYSAWVFLLYVLSVIKLTHMPLQVIHELRCFPHVLL